MQIPKENKKITLSLISGLLFIALITMSYLWNTQAQELQFQNDRSAQKIIELENKLKELDSQIEEDRSLGSIEQGIQDGLGESAPPTSVDEKEINSLLNSLCPNGKAKEVSLEQLEGKDGFGVKRFYNGYAQINVGCEGENGGYISFMQRKSDKSWKHLFGAQDTPSCEKINQYKIPKQISPKCISNQGQEEIPNSN